MVPLPVPHPYARKQPEVWAVQVTAEALAAADDVGGNSQYQDALSAARLRFLGATPLGDGVELDFAMDDGRLVQLVGSVGDYIVWTSDGVLQIVPLVEFESLYEVLPDPEPGGDSS